MIETDLIEAQQAVGEWAEENFGAEQPAHFPLLGAGEEMGELTTSVLKRAQGIDDHEKYQDRVGDEAEMDAIGDIFIYMMDFSYRSDVDMDDVTEWLGSGYTASSDDITDASERIGIQPPVMMAMFGLYGVYSEIIDSVVGKEDYRIEKRLGHLIEFLVLLSDIRGFSFDRAVADAMDEVLEREWDADIQVEE